MMDIPQADRVASSVEPRELFPVAILALATLLVCMYFAPRGFRGGFTDMAHDGYQLRQVLDLDAGGVIFKDTFDQYGPLSGYLNLAGYRLLGHTWLGVKYALSFWYAAIAFLIYFIARHLMPPGWSLAAVIVWLGLAPFYQHGVMVTPHVYILFFQAAGTLALIRFAETGRLRYVALVGVCCGLCWALKTTMGVLFAAGAIGYLVCGPLRGISTVRRTATALATLLALALVVVAVTLGWLWAHGALPDWYVQTVQFPRAFYFDERAVQAPSRIALPIVFAVNFLLLNLGVTGVDVAFYWHIMRLAVVVVALVLWRWRTVPEALFIIAFLTPVLWLAAYPSANFMHQWWTASLTIPAFVYCVRLAVRAAGERLPRIAPANEAWITAAVLAIVFWSGASERILATRERAVVLTETLDAPRVLKGIRTDKPTAEAFRVIHAAMVNFKKHHPTARVVSNDHCDGFSNCVAESLLWLSFLDDNRHDHPVYWPMPVLSTTLYPDYQARFAESLRQTPTLVVDSWTGANLPDNGIDGYQLLVGVRTPAGYWYVFAPDHPEAAEHAETTTRLDESGEAPAVRQVREYGARRALDDAVDPATGVAQKLPLYTWPAALDVPPLREPEPVEVTTAEFRDGDVSVNGGRWLVRGFLKSPYAPLLRFPERFVSRGEYFVATGTVTQGTCRFALMRNNEFAGYVDITRPGPFAVVLMPPRSGRYRLFFTNGLPVPWSRDVEERGLAGFRSLISRSPRPIAFDVDTAGWVTKDSEAPVTLVYRRDHPSVQLDSDEDLREVRAAAERADAEALLAEERRAEALPAEDRRAEERRAEQRQAEERRMRERRAEEQQLAAARDAELKATRAAPPAPPPAPSEPNTPVSVFGARRDSRHVVIGAWAGQGRHVPLFAWPAGIDVPEPLPEPVPLDESAIVERAAIATAEGGRWLVRGSARARYSYLLTFKEQAVGKGEYFVALGTVTEGGFTLGLQQDEKWVGMANVTEPGPFAVVLMPPVAGRYTLVLANNVTESTSWQLVRRHGVSGLWNALAGARLPNVFQIERAGWVVHAPIAPVDPASAVAAKTVGARVGTEQRP